MKDFVHRQNIEHYRGLLRRSLDADERARIQTLLDEELAKDVADADAPDPCPGRTSPV